MDSLGRKCVPVAECHKFNFTGAEAIEATPGGVTKPPISPFRRYRVEMLFPNEAWNDLYQNETTAQVAERIEISVQLNATLFAPSAGRYGIISPLRIEAADDLWSCPQRNCSKKVKAIFLLNSSKSLDELTSELRQLAQSDRINGYKVEPQSIVVTGALSSGAISKFISL